MPKGQFVNAFHTVPLPCSIYVLSTFPFRFPRLFKDSHHVLFFLTASQELVKLFKAFFFLTNFMNHQHGKVPNSNKHSHIGLLPVRCYMGCQLNDYNMFEVTLKNR